MMRREWGRLTSMLLARFRRIDLVEDALGDAFESASLHWPTDGVPSNPAAWLHTAARRRILDRLRAEAIALRKRPLLVVEAELEPERRSVPDDDTVDETLRLALMCSHPALAPEAASALTLRLVLGVPTGDIARLFLVSDATMAARLTRAKKKVVAAGIPFAMPDEDALPERLDTLAQTAYLAFTAGYAPGSGPDVVRTDLAGEAVRLTQLLLTRRRDEPVLVALLALMLLQHSRRGARTSPNGQLILLADQDRARWHHDEIATALELLDHAALTGPITVRAASYVLQARIAAEHAIAARPADTRWQVVVELYDALIEVAPTPSARLARVVAIAEVRGPDAGLAALSDLDVPGHRLPAVRAELLTRAGRAEEAAKAYDTALALCHNDAERTHLAARRARSTPAITIPRRAIDPEPP